MQRTLTGSTPSILLPVNLAPSTSSEKYTIVPDKALMASSDVGAQQQQQQQKESTPAEATTTDDSRTPSPALKTDDKKSVFADLNIDTTMGKAEGPTSSISSTSSNCDPSQSTASPSTSALDENAGQQKPVKKRRAARKPAVVEEASRKSNRINKTLEKNAEVIDNYTGLKDLGKPRGNKIPVGLKRVSYDFPSKILKENGRLRIDMNGPSTRSNPAEVSYTPMRNRARETAPGPECQAIMPEYAPDAPDDDVCREEAIWVPTDSEEQKFDDEQLNQMYITIQKQYGETMPMDAILHRLMVSGYDLDKMLETIEKERERLPMPSLKFTNVQQAEFERQIRKNRASSNFNRTIPRAHRNMQERFLRYHYLGEIIKYYYDTKHKCCTQKQYNRCKCTEAMAAETAKIVERVECANCTKLVRPNAEKAGLLCGLCKLYFERNNTHRISQDMFNDEEETLLTKWVEFEKSSRSLLTLAEVKKKIEEDRVADIASRQLTSEEISALGPSRRKDRVQVAKMFAVYEPENNSEAEATSNVRLKEYDDEKKFEFIQAFEQFGKDYVKVGDAVKCSELEVGTFFVRFRLELNLPAIITEAMNNNNNSNNTNTNSRSKEKERNTSRDSTPYEPTEKIIPEKAQPIQRTITTRKRVSDAAAQSLAAPPKRRSLRV